jgi:hypothetical protein
MTSPEAMQNALRLLRSLLPEDDPKVATFRAALAGRNTPPASARGLPARSCVAGVCWGRISSDGRSTRMQTLKLLRRRFPTAYPLLVMLIGLVLLGALVLGVGLLVVR